MTRSASCSCAAYTGPDQHEPQKEQDAGRVRILSTSEPGWSMTYVVECVACGRVFNVTQVDGPAVQWHWVPRGEKRKRVAR